jgi:hypothetical protein
VGICFPVTQNWENVMEREWGRAFVHESGHALMAVLQEISCHGIYYEKGINKFCTLTNLPPASELSEKHYLFLTASGAAELIIYGDRDQSGADADKTLFSSPGAPSFEETLNQAHTILLTKKRQLKQLISNLKAKCRQVDYDLMALPEMGMDGTDRKFAVLLSKEELEDAVRRN